MTNYNAKEEKDEILYAFHLECENPTPKNIITWVKRYPQYADDIREHAELLLAQKSVSKLNILQPDEEMLVKGRSETMNAIYEFEQKVARNEHDDAESESNKQNDLSDDINTTSVVDFDLLLKNAGTSIAELARDINIERNVVAKVAAGRVCLPVGDRFLSAIASLLGLTKDMIVSAIQLSLQNPRFGHAKSRDKPEFQAVAYKDIVTNSTKMTPEQIQYWLDEPSSWMPGTRSD